MDKLGEYWKLDKPSCVVKEINKPNYTLMAIGLINLYNQLKEEGKIDEKLEK